MKKILFLNFNCNWCPHFETDLELMKSEQENGNEVFSLSCNRVLNKYCVSNANHDSSFCRHCEKALKKGLNTINLDCKHQLKLHKVKVPDFPVFNTINELKNYTADGVNIGFGVASSYMSLSRDYLYSPAQHKDDISNYLKSAYIVMKNLEKIVRKNRFDAVYLFNGRFQEYYPAMEICKRENIDLYFHERGSSKETYQVLKNTPLHGLARVKQEIQDFWENEKDYDTKKQIAEKWYTERRCGQEQCWISFTSAQMQNSIPKDFDTSKENIAIFNSSMDEYACFDDWQSPIDTNDNNIIEAILDSYKNDENKHFYLRIHPNLKGLNETTQIKQLKEIEKKFPKNLTVIKPDETVDTYKLLEVCDRTIVFGSTVGAEACFWGKPCILGGKAFYEGLDCTYNASTFEELFSFIKNKNLQPKPKENSYPYAFWSSEYGTEFKYFEPTSLFCGLFLGTDLHQHKKTIADRIQNEWTHFIKKVLKR